MWKWSNYLHSKVPLTKKPLCVNIDESSIKLDQDFKHGHVAESARTLAKGHMLRRNIPKGIGRTAYSLVAVICDDAEIQKTFAPVHCGEQEELHESSLQGIVGHRAFHPETLAT